MNYFHYLLSRDDMKTRWLLREVQRDAVFAKIVDDLQAFGFVITHSFWEGSGMYQPMMVQGGSEAEFRERHARGEMKARFRIGTRHGAGAALFSLLHELVHFNQDLEGKIFAPKEVLEAQAAQESIAAALRLRDLGYPYAWRGAMGSINARDMAKKYERERVFPPVAFPPIAQDAPQTAATIWKKSSF